MNDAGRIVPLPKGNYDATVQYEFLDMVFDETTNATYIAKKNTIGNAPALAGTEFWQLVCAGAVVDTALSSTSYNPVANAVLKAAMDEKADTDGNLSDATVDSFTTTSGTFPVPAAGETLRVLFGKVLKWFSDARATFLATNGNAEDTTVDTFDTVGSSFPMPAAGESQNLLWGKVVKWFSDAASNFVKFSDIVNTGTVTAIGTKALDAVQNNPNVSGTLAAVMKRLGGMTSIPQSADLNTYTTPGEYYVGTNNTAATLTNCPSTAAGRLTVENSIASGGTYLKQTYAQHSSSNNGQYTWVRMSGNSGSSWSAWSLVEGAQLTQGTIDTTSVPNDTLTLIGSLDMPPGVYLVYLYVNFASASAGWRGAQIYGATLTSLGRASTKVNAITSAQTTVGNSYIFNWTASSTTCNFYVYQNCGAAINCNAEYRYVRLA